MNYRISDGIPESSLSVWLAGAAEKNGTFDDGRIDYTKADIAPVVMCTLVYKNKIFLAKRGHGLADANGYWSTINGFIDEDKPIAQIAAQEFVEELGLKLDSADIKGAPSFTIKNQLEKRSYIIFPCLAVVDQEPEIKLDREHTEFTWIDRKDLENYHILDDLPVVVDAALKLL